MNNNKKREKKTDMLLFPLFDYIVYMISDTQVKISREGWGRGVVKNKKRNRKRKLE